jgi:hypothetical protein
MCKTSSCTGKSMFIIMFIMFFIIILYSYSYCYDVCYYDVFIICLL